MKTSFLPMPSSRQKLPWCLLVIAACASFHPAYAQTTQNAEKPLAANVIVPVATVPVIVITGHYNNAVGTSDAASQGVVLGSLLQDRPLLRPGEVLETIPGLVVTQHSGDGKANQYFLRGYNLDHGTDLASSVDGVPANMPTNAHGQGYTDLNFLIPELVDHIDYRKGPYYADHGDFSAAGADDIKYRDTLKQSIADFTAGAFGYQRALLAGSITLAAPDGQVQSTSDIRLLSALELEKYNGPWEVPEGLYKMNTLLRLSEGTRANGWSIDGTAYQAYWNSTDQVPLALIQSGQLNRFGALDPTDGGDTGRDILSAEWHQHDADGYTRLSGFMEHYRLRLWSNFTFSEYRPLPGNSAADLSQMQAIQAMGDQFSQQESRNILGTSAVKGWTHKLFGFDSETEIGLQIRQDYSHVQLFDTDKRVSLYTVSDELIRETEIGTYLQNSTAWNEWLRTIVGLRFDNVHMNANSLNIAENSGTASGNKLSPKLSTVLGPWNKTEFFVNAGSGFHSNDARGVIDKVDPTTLLPSTPVPAFVGAVGKEIGLRTDAIPGLHSSMALWSLNSSSEIVYNADSDIGSTSPNGASKRYGLECNNNAEITRWLYIDANFAWTHARFASNNDNGAVGDYIPNAVGKVGSLGFTVHDLGPWSGELNTRYIGAYPLSQDGTLVGPSALVTNLRLQRTLTPNVAVSIDILNLFNRQYYDIAYEQDYQVTPTSAVVPNGITVHPGEPREARLTLRVKF